MVDHHPDLSNLSWYRIKELMYKLREGDDDEETFKEAVALFYYEPYNKGLFNTRYLLYATEMNSVGLIPYHKEVASYLYREGWRALADLRRNGDVCFVYSKGL